jgi:hypothetical protein
MTDRYELSDVGSWCLLWMDVSVTQQLAGNADNISKMKTKQL